MRYCRPVTSPFAAHGRRVLYESPDRNYVLVVTLTTQAPVLSPVGGRGWVNPIYLRAP
jgi:hypothetical protein